MSPVTNRHSHLCDNPSGYQSEITPFKKTPPWRSGGGHERRIFKFQFDEIKLERPGHLLVSASRITGLIEQGCDDSAKCETAQHSGYCAISLTYIRQLDPSHF